MIHAIEFAELLWPQTTSSGTYSWYKLLLFEKKWTFYEQQFSALTFGVRAQRGLQYLVCVCVSVTQHLTFYVITHATNGTNLLSGG